MEIEHFLVKATIKFHIRKQVIRSLKTEYQNIHIRQAKQLSRSFLNLKYANKLFGCITFSKKILTFCAIIHWKSNITGWLKNKYIGWNTSGFNIIISILSAEQLWYCLWENATFIVECAMFHVQWYYLLNVYVWDNQCKM